MRRKILLVDDNDALRADFPLWFREYEVTAAASGGAALALLSKPNEFELVLLDVQLPDMDGLAALEKIKAAAPEKKVIIMTGYSTKETAIHALTARADNYIEKPFELSAMRAAIDKALGAAAPETDGLDGKIAHVKRFVEDNCLGKVSLADAAAAVFLSPKYLSRVFREKAGVSFETYKLRVKMERAKKLLRGSEESVKQISLRLGYANAESFIRQFEKIVNQKPSCFRRSRRCR
jgi:two-component system response regulator YesN